MRGTCQHEGCEKRTNCGTTLCFKHRPKEPLTEEELEHRRAVNRECQRRYLARIKAEGGLRPRERRLRNEMAVLVESLDLMRMCEMVSLDD